MSDTIAPRRIIKADMVQVRRIDPTLVPVEDRLAEARDEAFRAGYEEGYTAGAVEAGAELARIAERFRREVLAAVAGHTAQVRSDRAADADQLVELAMGVAEWAVRRELSTVPTAFFARLEEMLADRDRRDRVEIATSPALAERTRDWVGDDQIEIVADDRLADGEARVVIGDTTVFATFADAFERARAALDALATDTDDGDGFDDDDYEVEVLYDATGADAA
jgi:flagellar biosynthesis/type III secretory pathway protein FliH